MAVKKSELYSTLWKCCDELRGGMDASQYKDYVLVILFVKYISDKIGVLHLGHLVETGTTEEIFDNPIHPYTKSLLSAIPHPNPRVEKVRKSFTYDYKESGVDYTKGTEHLVDGTHYVLATDEEFEKWTKK